uniref:Liver enriched gene 1-like protein n=1 Tax=Rousettus aegyptiacus TaxID=9407 RepID=A0A7J8K5N0_ROUAE|nr:liver enriched gene 1-like protein [Rousettus aegyptiacus]
MTFLPFWVFVLAGCFSVSLAEASNLSDLYPPLWEESPSQLNDYKVENGKYIVNPWVYPERLGAYKILLNKTGSYFEKFGPENKLNLLWGLPLQHGWQYTSGRLADPTQETDCGYESGDHLCISVDSWWADINYFLWSLPFLAAVDSGIMGISSNQVLLSPPAKDQKKFCLSVAACQSSFPKAMKKWKDFYQHLKVASSSFEDLLEYLWAAHTSTLETTHKAFEDRFQYYSKPEASFGRNWLVSVKYIGAIEFPTTLIKTHEFQKVLPQRMLVDGDKAPFINDFTELQNMVLLGLKVVYEVDYYTGSLSLTVMETLMKVPGAKKEILKYMEKILENATSKLLGSN